MKFIPGECPDLSRMDCRKDAVGLHRYQCLTALVKMDIAKLIRSGGEIGNRYSVFPESFIPPECKSRKISFRVWASEDEIDLVQVALGNYLSRKVSPTE